MENKDLVFNPQAEIVNFGVVDIVSSSGWQKDENETDMAPGGLLML